MNSWGSYSPAIASDFVKQFEGRELKAYRCSAGVWTIGYGHTKGVSEGDEISPAEAEQLLVEDLTAIADDLNRLVNVPVSEGQYIALLSLAFNVGGQRSQKEHASFPPQSQEIRRSSRRVRQVDLRRWEAKRRA